MDARKENLAFVEKPIPRCKYFLASQCDPSLFDACKDREVWIYHGLSCGEGSREHEVLNEYYLGKWRHIPGGGTVGLRAITLARILGFELIHIYGLDSCLSPEATAALDGYWDRKGWEKRAPPKGNGRFGHAYQQDFNDPDKKVVPIHIGGRKFACSRWHCAQWHQFKEYLFTNGQHVHLNVHGEGMIAHTLRTGADAWRSWKEGEE